MSSQPAWHIAFDSNQPPDQEKSVIDTKMPTHRSTISVSGNRSYPGGYMDKDVEEFAHEDGQATVHKPSVFGENVHAHAIDVLNAAHDTEAGLIGHAYRAGVQATAASLEADIPKAVSAEQTVLTLLDEWRLTQISLIQLRHQIESRGLAAPSSRTLWWLIGGVALLFLGETGLISAGYQLFGLSDTPFIPLVTATDELHLAAYASVTALLIAAHVAGYKLRLMTHDLERRRQAVTDDARAQLPKPSTVNAVLIGVCVVFAMFVLYGLSAIRADYLVEQGVNARTLPFLAIQVGIFGAALMLSFSNTHPYGRQWADQTRVVKKADKAKNKAEDAFNTIVGTVNAAIDQLSTLLAQAGHHVGISESDVRRQAPLYVGRVLLSQPEPTQERLFPAQLPQPTSLAGDELAEFLVGIAPDPRFEKFSTDAVAKRHDAIRHELRDMVDILRTGRPNEEIIGETGVVGDAP